MKNDRILSDAKQLDAVLANYSTLRAEILLWTRNELVIITALFTVITGLIGYSLTSSNYIILPIIPVLAFFGVYFWFADHCMIRILSSYISEEIEKKRLPKIIGKMGDNSLWVGWENFVQNKDPSQLRNRGADRTTIVLLFLWFNIIIIATGFSIIFITNIIDFNTSGVSKDIIKYILIGLNIIYYGFGGYTTYNILSLSNKKFRQYITNPNKFKKRFIK